MSGLLQKLPTILVIAVLLAMFFALRRHDRSQRMRFWTWAWLLIFIHFVAQAFEAAASPLVDTVNSAALALASVLFVISLLRLAANLRQRLVLAAVTGIPVLAYAAGLAYGVHSVWLYAVCIGGIFFVSTAVCAHFDLRLLSRLRVATIVVLFAGVWSMVRALHGDFDFGFLAVLGVGYATAGMLFWNVYRRMSPGVFTVMAGFLSWGAVFPAAALAAEFAPGLALNPDLWNVPKFFVAFGMIMTTIEDATERELASRRQLERFGVLNSRMLHGEPADKVCHEVCAALVDTSTFRRVYIVLRTPGGAAVAGYAGLSKEAVAELQQNAPHWGSVDIDAVIDQARRLGANSYVLDSGIVDRYQPVTSERTYAPELNWRRGCKAIVPIPSRRGGYLGCITFDEPRDPVRVNAEEMSRVELLAADLAIALENEELQRQLVRSEKMAAMGQLVTGVAHELNNPLAAVLGYADLLNETTSGVPQQQLQKLTREAKRMKQILGGLLSFARQDIGREQDTDVETILREVVGSSDCRLQSLGVDIEVDFDPGLPRVAADRDHMRQIMLNLINNAVDAVSRSQEKRIRVKAKRQGEKVMICVEDSGSGFADLHRAMDPFYTTKPVGKGPGLGLSICYGIVKELGGNVHLQNSAAGGAAVTIDIPSAAALSKGSA